MKGMLLKMTNYLRRKKVMRIEPGYTNDLLIGLHDVIPGSCLFTIVPPPVQQNCPLTSASTNTSIYMHTILHSTSDSCSSCSSSSCATYHSFSSPYSSCELPSPLTGLYSDEYEGIDDDSVLTKAKELFQSISISDKQAKLIEKATRAQRVCTEWTKQRVGRLTASSFHDILYRELQLIHNPLQSA